MLHLRVEENDILHIIQNTILPPQSDAVLKYFSVTIKYGYFLVN